MKRIYFNEIIEKLRDSDKWSEDRYTLINDEYKITIWTANGFFGVNFYPNDIKLSFFQRIKLYSLIKEIKEKMILNKVRV